MESARRSNQNALSVFIVARETFDDVNEKWCVAEIVFSPRICFMAASLQWGSFRRLHSYGFDAVFGRSALLFCTVFMSLSIRISAISSPIEHFDLHVRFIRSQRRLNVSRDRAPSMSKRTQLGSLLAFLFFSPS